MQATAFLGVEGRDGRKGAFPLPNSSQPLWDGVLGKRAQSTGTIIFFTAEGSRRKVLSTVAYRKNVRDVCMSTTAFVTGRAPFNLAPLGGGVPHHPWTHPLPPPL